MAELTKWYEKAGNCGDVVCSTRVRLARNLKQFPFPARATDKQLEAVEQSVKDALLSGNSILSKEFRFIPLDNISEEEAVSLVERHIVSPEFISDRHGKAVLISEDESISIMINEEDHLRIQVLREGLSLKEAAALPTAGVTALDILNTLKEKKDKGNVLVLGGSGGVGHLLIQLLQIHGYNVTAGASIKNFAFLKELGTNKIFDYHDDYKTKYKDQFDAAIDFIGDDIGIGLYEVLKENGLLVTVPSYSFNKVISACPSCKQVKSVLAAPSREKIAYLLKLCSSGKLKVHITKEFKLNTEGAQLAHLQIESTHTRGKIILVP